MQKNVLITGAAKRIGAACARRLHEAGCHIVIHYKSSEREALALCEDLNRLRADSATTLQADLLDISGLQDVAETACGFRGGIDVLINNASAFYSTPFGEVTEAEWDELFGSNLKAPFFLTQALKETLQQRRGCVVNIVDIHSERGLPGFSAYSIAKAGLAAMTRVLAKEMGPEVRVNGVAPGAIIWPEHGLSEEVKELILQRVALRRSGVPDDIAKAVLFLIRDADYTTGQILSVDGGRTLFY